jgi:PTH1 family peptidyl-tRNA hydrolase
MVIERFHVPAASILVVSDDVDLPLGSMRYRTEGGPGGHNGLKSLISCLGTQIFARMKIGVGAPSERITLEDYVLGKFIKEEHGVIDRVVVKALESLDSPTAVQETTWTV